MPRKLWRASPGGETGRHAGLKILWPEMAVRVQVPPRVLHRETRLSGRVFFLKSCSKLLKNQSGTIEEINEHVYKMANIAPGTLQSLMMKMVYRAKWIIVWLGRVCTRSRTTNRYLFPLILNTTLSSPTKSAADKHSVVH